MANVFNAAEIIDMGIEKEKKRRDFYGLVATKFKKNDMKNLFTKLRDWEETHIQKFTEIRNSVEESEIVESCQGEFEAYINGPMGTFHLNATHYISICYEVYWYIFMFFE